MPNILWFHELRTSIKNHNFYCKFQNENRLSCQYMKWKSFGEPSRCSMIYWKKKSLKIRLYRNLYIHIIIHDDDQILLVHHLKSSQSYLLLQALLYSHQLCTGFNQLLTGKSNLCFTFAWASYFSHSSQESLTHWHETSVRKYLALMICITETWGS